MARRWRLRRLLARHPYTAMLSDVHSLVTVDPTLHHATAGRASTGRGGSQARQQAAAPGRDASTLKPCGAGARLSALRHRV